MGLYPAIDMSQAILSLLFGGLIGFSLGLLGGGGSILTVPILVYLIGQDVHAATGTSLAIVGASALFGALANSRSGNVRMKSGFIFGLMSMIGAIPGVWLNRIVAGKVILILFGFLMIAVAISMLHKKIAHPEAKAAAIPCEPYTPKDWFRLLLLRTAKVMQRTQTVLACVYGLFVMAMCCITYVVFYKTTNDFHQLFLTEDWN